jgi:hypothetical protein
MIFPKATTAKFSKESCGINTGKNRNAMCENSNL